MIINGIEYELKVARSDMEACRLCAAGDDVNFCAEGGPCGSVGYWAVKDDN